MDEGDKALEMTSLQLCILGGMMTEGTRRHSACTPTPCYLESFDFYFLGQSSQLTWQRFPVDPYKARFFIRRQRSYLESVTLRSCQG